MSNALQLIANEQKRLADKRQEKLNKKLDQRVRLRTAWHASGIPALWEQVKHLEVKNFARGDVAGFRAPLASFVVPCNWANVYDTGLTLYADHDGGEVVWDCFDNNAGDMLYRHSVPNRSSSVYTPEKFRDTFIAWLAKKIDPETIANLGVEAKEMKQTVRRILAETAAE